MVEEKDIRKVIKRVCIETLGYADLRDDEDYFDRGASSLTIVELQLQIEAELGLKVPTSDLMLDPSIAGWSRIYSAAQPEMPVAPLPVTQP
ncbi:acyl carrier protein [Verminephrobacter aporrectodeae subsp. tuberculatae]|uniref:acyl carrier protein n=1 Tax=Verminephrobacter aporrectodeae TaxID=1110389 RepID=UPI002244DC96|nr:acyl carrier protein [Verminephrobacter aporrectodeae]MCW8209171.1 acyl carrier protein [Verminephrobacter aporrectodeae subsp. tuberculatae]